MGRETLDIQLEPIIGEQAEVQVQLLSPPFRNEVGVTLATFTLGGALKWLILVAAAVAADEIKRLLVLPLRHLQRLLRVPVR
jgi:hypothetical protein